MAGKELTVVKTKAMVKSEENELPLSVVSYERVGETGYTFSRVFDQQRSVNLEFTEQEYKESEFVDAIFDEEVKGAKKEYYAVAAACGLLTATLSQVRLTDLLEIKDKLAEKDIEKYVIMAARVAGYKKDDIKGASQFILKKAVPFMQGHIPSQLLDYFYDLSSNPRLSGLVFSVITQFTGEKYQINEKGKVTKKKVPSYYAIGRYPAEKILYGFLYWVFALAANTAVSKKSVVDDLKIPKELVGVLREYVDIPLLKKIPENLQDAEVKYSCWIQKLFEDSEIIEVDGTRTAFNLLQLIMGTAVEAIEESFPVLLNECLFRGFYFIKQLSGAARKIGSFNELETLDPHDVLPFNNQVVSKMAVIASGTFMAADLACAAIRVLLKTRGKPKDFVRSLRAEANIAGVGRFILAVGADSKYWVENVRVLFVRNNNEKEYIDYEDVIGADPEANAVFSSLALEPVQARLLYCFESEAVLEDIKGTKDEKVKKRKEKWLSEWQSQIVKGLEYQDDDFFSASLEELHVYLKEQGKSKANYRWIYLMAMELALFKAYQPLGTENDSAYSKLKFDAKTVETVFLKKQGIVKFSQWKDIRSAYSKHYGMISGNTQNTVLGVGISALVVLATGGLASVFAPQIAVVLAGEAVAGLHGAALTSASLAFVGGGALAAGGGGMAAGAAIITGGGALLGAAGSGSVSMIAMMAQANPGLWARQGAKLATFCSAVLHDILQADGAVRSILTGTEEAKESVEKMIEGVKEDESPLDKEFLKILNKYKQYIERTEKEIQKVLK